MCIIGTVEFDETNQLANIIISSNMMLFLFKDGYLGQSCTDLIHSALL